jgi:predicted GNAT family acetyltransferase
MAANVVDNPSASRFDLLVDDKPAGLIAYTRHGPSIALVHTQVDPAYEGKGYGSVLARGALEALRAEGVRVIPLCPFIQGYLKRHPEYLDLVSPEERARHGLG